MRPRLLLVGGGHAHLAVLEDLARRRWPAVDVTLVSPGRHALYSGMLPGWLAGRYPLDALRIPLTPLASRAGAAFLEDRLVALEAGARAVTLASGARLTYDVLSLAPGAEVACEGAALLPGVTLATRPLEALVAGWPVLLAGLRARGAGRLVVLGGGAAGVEVALAARHALREVPGVEVVLVDGGVLLPGHAAGAAARVREACRRHGVTLRRGPARCSPAGLLLPGGEALAAEATVIATGARPPGWLAASGLALAPDGFLAVGPELRSCSHPEVFAAGDLATGPAPGWPKAGVFAVRAGPVLARNLRRVLAGQAPGAFRPRAWSLALIATRPGQAIAAWGPLSWQGGWVWRWKDWLDRGFVRHHGGGAAAGSPLAPSG